MLERPEEVAALLRDEMRRVRLPYRRIGEGPKEAAMGEMTVEVPLTTKEIELIRFAIERYRKVMLFEIANTDSHDLRTYLKQREELFEALVKKLDSYVTRPEGAAK